MLRRWPAAKIPQTIQQPGDRKVRHRDGLILEPRFKMAEKTHGGARKGAGRKPGAIRKATAAAQAKAAEGGVLPLDFMLDRMRDPEAPMGDRMDMAKAAAPFVHAKLSSVEMKAEIDGTLAVTQVELVGG